MKEKSLVSELLQVSPQLLEILFYAPWVKLIHDIELSQLVFKIKLIVFGEYLFFIS